MRLLTITLVSSLYLTGCSQDMASTPSTVKPAPVSTTGTSTSSTTTTQTTLPSSSASVTSLEVSNINGEIAQTILPENPANSAMRAPTKMIYIQNAVTGRHALVQVDFSSKTGLPISVSRGVDLVYPNGSRAALVNPYFCLDHTKPVCARVAVPTGRGFVSEGQLLPNCSSPVKFTGALNGWINDIDTEAGCI